MRISTPPPVSIALNALTERRQQAPGFALVATVSMMVLLTLVALGMLSLSTIEQRSSGENEENLRTARANARMALMIALGELQEAAGPDQRVTATASLLGDSGNAYTSGTIAEDGKKHWVGVWDTSAYTPETPNAKTFVRWLVSGSDADVDTIADVGAAPAADDLVIFAGADAAGTVKVPKVDVATTGGNTSHYAYWIEDEGVKADLAWNEGSFTDEDREQAARLSAAPGPDHGVFGGPFATGVSYPLEEGGSNAWLDKLDKAFSPADMPLVMGSTTSQTDWLQKHRHDIGMNSLGVMADVKKGGLRRDLSLAFEMDGAADVSYTEQPILFNLQHGEFVGGNDNLQALYPYTGMTFAETYTISNTEDNDQYSTSSHDATGDGIAGLAPGMPVKERFLYRVTKNDGSPFSDQLKRYNFRHSHTPSHSWAPLYGWYPNSVVRGPNWWALRDYYNLYKRVTKTSGSYSLESRSYYPNNSADPSNLYAGASGAWHKNYRLFGQPAFPYATYHYDMETSQFGDYVFKPATPNYTPVYMGMVALYSMKVTNYNIGVNAGTNKGDLTLAIDPLIYLWNPFNVTIKADRYALELQRGHGGKMSFIVVKPDGSEQKYGPAKTDIYMQKEAGGGGNLTYLVRNLVMEPGEVMILSPGAGSSNTELHDEATPGTNLTDLSGISTKWMPSTIYDSVNQQWDLQSWTNGVKVGPGDTIRCLYDICLWHGSDGWLTNSAEHYWMATFLPYDKNILPSQLINADSNADRVQQVGGNFASRIDWGFKEYFVPDLQNRLDANGDIIGYPSTSWPAITLTNPPAADSKFFFGINSHILKPTNYTKVDGSAMPNRHAVEVFSQFNPYRTSTYVAGHRTNVLNETYSSLSTPGSVNTYIQEVGIQFPTASGQGDRGFWGETMHANGGSTSVPFAEIPTSPILSLADFANANLSLRSEAAYKDVGNSHASVFVPGNTIYGGTGMSPGVITTSDNVWLINDAIFDRYYLSGIAPGYDYSGTGGVYNPTGTLNASLTNFYGSDYTTAKANPALLPYLPKGKTANDVIAELDPNDPQYNTTSNIYEGYKKVGAYSMIKGAFNVNSTSVKAWAAMLRTNRNLALDNTSNNAQTGTGTPYSSMKSPVTDAGADTGWDGFSRLTDDEIWDDNGTPNNLADDSGLAVEIVNQIKARGPFMSISDFVNRQVSSNTDLNASGAIQKALDTVAATQSDKTAAGGLVPHDPSVTGWGGYPILHGDADMTNRRTTEGIAADIRQADVLRALAPRLSARSDTFRIRAYGEVRDASDNIVAKATCEAVVQRLPEYVDPETDPSNNEPWDDDSKTPVLNTSNQTYGRRYEIRSFRWLDENEV